MYSIKTFIIFCIALSLPLIHDVEAKGSRASNTTLQLYDWNFVADSETKSCYIYTDAKRFKGYDEEIEDAYLYVKLMGHRQYTLGIKPGTDIQDGSAIHFNLNNRDREIYTTQTNNGWTYSSIQDIAIINDMIQSDTYIKIHAIAYDGHDFVEYYSLKGFNNALKKLDTCNKPAKTDKAKKKYKAKKKTKSTNSLSSLG